MKKHLVYWLKICLLYGWMCAVYGAICAVADREFSVSTVVIEGIVIFVIALCYLAKYGPHFTWRRPPSGRRDIDPAR